LTRVALAFLVVALVAAPSQAMEQRRLIGSQIEMILNDRTARYADGARQFFSAAGWTDYRDADGTVDRGRWEVRGNQYCSWWERGGWSCYDVMNAWQDVTFIGAESGRTYLARMADGNQLVD
jgi:hypothetical protein